MNYVRNAYVLSKGSLKYLQYLNLLQCILCCLQICITKNILKLCINNICKTNFSRILKMCIKTIVKIHISKKICINCNIWEETVGRLMFFPLKIVL